MPGPKPTPTAILEQRGSWRAKDRTHEPVPDLPDGLTPPAGLTGKPLSIFLELGPRLIGVGLLTVADLPTFSRYCRLYVAWENAYDLIGEEPDRSAVLTLAKLDEMLRKLEANFGLSPADRTGISVEKKTDGKSRFFK